MTVVATWYRQKFNQVWSAADLRVSQGDVVASDNAPKILPIRVVTHRQVGASRWATDETSQLGFAYAGSTLTAISSYALGNACCQSLAKAAVAPAFPAISDIAEIFRKAGEHYIRDVSSRLIGTQVPSDAYFFAAHVFGWCRKENKFKLSLLLPTLDNGKFSMQRHDLDLIPGRIYPIGSGAEDLLKISAELDATGKGGTIYALREMLKRNPKRDVGGYFQCGLATGDGNFHLMPILNLDGGPLDHQLTLLGVKLDDLVKMDGYGPAFAAFSPDID